MARYRWRNRNPKADIHSVMRRSALLFAPGLDIKWKFATHEAMLIFEGTCLWSTHRNSDGWFYSRANSWIDQTMGDAARIISDYLDTPVAMLRKREFLCTRAKGWKLGDAERLYGYLLAADRRLGKNLQSVWLFKYNDSYARTISGRRL